MAGVTQSVKVDANAAHRAALAPKRIALFTGAYNHIADGVSLTLNRLVRYLEAQGGEVLVFAPTVEAPPVEHAGTLVPARAFPFPGYPDYHVTLGLSRAARARLAAFDPTLFHIATPDYLGLTGFRIARKRGTPVVASYHTHFDSYLKYYRLSLFRGAIWRYLRWLYGQCEHLYVPSASMADVLRAHGIRKGLRLWERGVDTMLFNPARRSGAWRQSLGIDDDEVVVTFVGRLVWEKGLDVFADVIEALEARGVPHRSMMVGDGPVRAELAPRLTRTIFTGHLEDEALARAYASSDVFFFPSDTETFGNVTLEAMASGLPAVCADATGSRSLVERGTTGLLAPPGRAPAFRDAVERLVTDHALRRQMGEAALARARTYEWNTILARIAGYYDEVLNPGLSTAGDGVQGEPVAPDLSMARPVRLQPSTCL